MNVTEFTYTKPNGSVSQRTLLTLSTPNTYFEGIDLSELEMDQYAQFIQQFKQIENDYNARFDELLNNFDVTTNYRRFVPERMASVVKETL